MKSIDAVVVGGGIIGLATALRLAEAGLEVEVYESGQAGSEASTAGAGILAAQALTVPPVPGSPDTVMQAGFFQSSLQARSFYPLFAAKVADLSGRPVACAMEGVLQVAFDDEGTAALGAATAWQGEQSLPARTVSAGGIAALAPGVQGVGGAFFPEDGWVDNQALMAAFPRVARDAGIAVHELTPVTRVLTEGDRVTGVATAGASVTAGVVVLANGAWADTLLPEGEPALGMRPVRGQILVLDAGSRAPAIPVVGGEYYVVPRPEGRVLVGTTVEDAGFDRSVTAAGVEEMLAGVRRFVPESGAWRLVTAWAGLRPRPSDNHPVVGPAVRHRGLWLATGHYRNGILWAPLTAEWITRGILGGDNPGEVAGLFHPERLDPVDATRRRS